MPYPSVGFPIPPFEWPHIGRQWPPHNVELAQTKELMAWWSSLASRGAGSLRDVSGHGRDGSLVGATWVGSHYGPVLDFDGGDDYVPTSCDLSGVDDFTVEVFFKADSTNISLLAWEGDGAGNGWGANHHEWHISLGHWTGAAVVNDGIGLWMTDTNLTVLGNSINVEDATFTDTTNWHHVIGTIQGSITGKLYLDGQLVGTDTADNAVSKVDWDTDFRLARPGADQRYFDGQILFSRVYNGVASEAEAYQMYIDLWELCHPRTRRPWMLVPTAGQQYFQSAAGVLIPAGAIIKRAGLPRAGTLTPAGTIIKMTATPRAGTLTPAGAITKRAGLSFTGAFATAGAVVKKTVRSLAGTLTTAGTVAKKAAISLAGTLTLSGAVAGIKIAFKALAGTLTTAGALARRTGKPLAGALTTAGAITRRVSVSLAGTLISAGTVVKKTALSFAGVLTTAGALAAEAITTIPVALTLWTRSVALTLKDRSQSLTLWARNLSLTLRDRE